MKVFRTEDLTMVAALKCAGAKVLSIETVGRRGTFTVETDKQLLTDYDLDNLRVEPKQFNATIKALTTAVRRASE